MKGNDLLLRNVNLIHNICIHERFLNHFYKIAFVQILKIIQNQIVSWFMNLSFSVYLLVFLVLVFFCFHATFDVRRVFLLLTFGLGITFISLSQFSVHGLRYALPGSDTGNTRFMMPLFPLVILALASVYSSRTEKLFSSELARDGFKGK